MSGDMVQTYWFLYHTNMKTVPGSDLPGSVDILTSVVQNMSKGQKPNWCFSLNILDRILQNLYSGPCTNSKSMPWYKLPSVFLLPLLLIIAVVNPRIVLSYFSHCGYYYTSSSLLFPPPSFLLFRETWENCAKETSTAHQLGCKSNSDGETVNTQWVLIRKSLLW